MGKNVKRYKYSQKRVDSCLFAMYNVGVSYQIFRMRSSYNVLKEANNEQSGTFRYLRKRNRQPH